MARNGFARWLCLVAATGALAVAPPARASGGMAFFVSPSGSDMGTCQTASPLTARCQTIGYALTQHRSVGGAGDTINLDAGTYAENVLIDQTADQSLTIVGAGAGATIISSTADATCNTSVVCAVKLGAVGGGTPTAATVKNLTVQVPAGASASKRGIELVGSGAVLSGVSVDMESSAMNNFAQAVGMDATGPQIDHLTVSGGSNWNGRGIFGASGAGGFTMTDSSITSKGDSVNIDGGASGPTVVIQRSRLLGSGAALTIRNASFTLDSSLIAGGTFGIGWTADVVTNPQGLVRNVTIDEGVAGVDDSASDRSIAVQSQGNGVNLNLMVDSSILVEPNQASAAMGTAAIRAPTTTRPVAQVGTAIPRTLRRACSWAARPTTGTSSRGRPRSTRDPRRP